jgi:hypothetical protein
MKMKTTEFKRKPQRALSCNRETQRKKLFFLPKAKFLIFLCALSGSSSLCPQWSIFSVVKKYGGKNEKMYNYYFTYF